MPTRPPMSRGELDVARTVWELEEGTVGQVHDRLAARKAIDYTTVQTYLRRLEQKGYLRTRRIGRSKLYKPKVSAGRVIREMTDDLLNRLFDGQTLALMQHLIHEQGISPEETEQLRQMLDQWETESGKRGGDSDDDD